MLILLLIWLAIGAGLTLITSGRQGSIGLPLAYFLGLSLIHVPGALIYVDGEAMTSTAGVATRIGFEQTLIGMASFLSGVLLARSFNGQHDKQWLRKGEMRDGRNIAAIERLSLLFIGIGIIVYFLLLPLASFIPSGTSVLSPLGSLIVVGFALRIWVAKQQRNLTKFWSTVFLLPLLPLSTVIQGGFIGFGVYWALAIVTFMFAHSTRKATYFLAAPAVFFVVLSFFVNYMAARSDIRRLVWIEQASIADRLQRVVGVFTNFKWLDLSDPSHQQAIDERLNQNILVGLAVQRLETGLVEYASGATLETMVISLIPRALWPDKPVVGGGGTIVSDFTGLQFAEGTSVGAGQVLEFYINFGIAGVISGFLIYGFLIGRMDLLATNYLDQRDLKRFLVWFLVGLALLQPGGNLVEITVAAVGSIVAAYGIGRLLLRNEHRIDSVMRDRRYVGPAGP